MISLCWLLIFTEAAVFTKAEDAALEDALAYIQHKVVSPSYISGGGLGGRRRRRWERQVQGECVALSHEFVWFDGRKRTVPMRSGECRSLSSQRFFTRSIQARVDAGCTLTLYQNAGCRSRDFEVLDGAGARLIFWNIPSSFPGAHGRFPLWRRSGLSGRCQCGNGANMLARNDTSEDLEEAEEEDGGAEEDGAQEDDGQDDEEGGERKKVLEEQEEGRSLSKEERAEGGEAAEDSAEDDDEVLEAPIEDSADADADAESEAGNNASFSLQQGMEATDEATDEAAVGNTVRNTATHLGPERCAWHIFRRNWLYGRRRQGGESRVVAAKNECLNVRSNLNNEVSSGIAFVDKGCRVLFFDGGGCTGRSYSYAPLDGAFAARGTLRLSTNFQDSKNPFKARDREAWKGAQGFNWDERISSLKCECQ